MNDLSSKRPNFILNSEKMYIYKKFDKFNCLQTLEAQISLSTNSDEWKNKIK